MSGNPEHALDSPLAAWRAPLGWPADPPARPAERPARASWGPPRLFGGDPIHSTRRIPGLLRRRIRPRLVATTA